MLAFFFKFRVLYLYTKIIYSDTALIVSLLSTTRPNLLRSRDGKQRGRILKAFWWFYGLRRVQTMASILVYGIQIFLNNTVYSLGLEALNIIQMSSVSKFVLKLTIPLCQDWYFV